MSHSDQSQRFLFDDTDVRGEMVDLERSYSEVLAKHPYPEPVAQLLGEMLAAASLLCGTLKFDGLLVLQARSSGAVPLLMVECSSDRQVRGLARYSAESIGADAGMQELMPEGVLTLTVDPVKGQRYQGIVALEGVNLAECLSNYFASSEQLPTRFWLNANGRRARGLLLQQLPADRLKDPEAREASWQHLTTLADTLTAEELLALDNEPSCTASTTRKPCACSSRNRWSSIAVARGNVRPTPWSVSGRPTASGCSRRKKARSPSTASSATSATCSTPPTSPSCSLALAARGLPRPATDDFSSSGLFWHNPATFFL